METSFVTTVLNEQKHIYSLFKSLDDQVQQPDEIIVVDGGSSDLTVEKIKNQKSKIKMRKVKFKILLKKGNRAVGRNEGIRQAMGDIILVSDAGCVLDKDWIKNIIKPFEDPKVDVVAGYYKGLAKTVFQKCLIPYVLVMEDKVNPENFLPATRSMAFRKSIWKKIGGFPQECSHNEDYVFSKKIKRNGANIVFRKDAIAYWIPKNSTREAFIMFFRFALGDAEAGILRPKVLLLLLRYCINIFLLIVAILAKSYLLFYTILLLGGLYIAWAIKKNYKYVKELKAVLLLPLLQLIADIAILIGTILGTLNKVRKVSITAYDIEG